MKLSLALAGLLFLVVPNASAQQTWVVNVLGGPGVDFTDLPGAVLAAATGDTIIVQSAIGQGASGFTTSKGLTILGEGGAVPIDSWTPVVVSGLPPGEVFRMLGFSKMDSGPLNFVIEGCLGEVHLERISAHETPMFPTYEASIEILNSKSVTLRDVTTFGYPAVEVHWSTVQLSQCYLGTTKIGLGGGVAISGDNSTINIIEPHFNTGWGVPAAIDVHDSALTITGDSQSEINNVGGGNAVFYGSGSLTVDPAVSLVAGPGALPILGAGTVVSKTVSATWSEGMVAGQPLTLSTWAEPASAVFQAIGAPDALSPSAFGTLGIDLLSPVVFLPGTISPANGLTQTTLPVPASLLPGAALATQAIVFAGAAIELGLPCYLVSN
jgi:hypothetical protein